MTLPEFSSHTRSEILNKIKNDSGHQYDTIIIGGGIVGAGLARELAIRKKSTLLVEKNDFASGTSSKSSKLIHGGLRYLEMFDFKLVFEALSERHWLLKTHPHLVHPLEFNLPIYKSNEAPKGSRSSTLLGLGLWLYDSLSFFRTPFFHGKHTAKEALKNFPGLKPKGLQGSYYYADAMMLDDELVLEVLYDAFKRGVNSINYCEAIKVRNSESGFTVTLNDTLDKNSKPFTVQTKEVAVCVGPWTESFGNKLPGGAQKKLKPSKGVHLIFPWSKLPIQSCIVMYAPDGRIVFAIPRKDLGAGAEVVIVGTTDSSEKVNLDNVRANSSDVDYLIKILKDYFTGITINKSDILTTYAGVRPLIDDGSETEAKISREHEIWRNEKGIVFMAGGKYTTFRKISQEIADFIFPNSSPESFGVNEQLTISDPKEFESRFTGQKIWGRYTEGWVSWKLKHHMPCNLDDVVFRRIPIWMGGNQNHTKSQILKIAEICAKEWGWSSVEMNNQVDGVMKKLAHNP